MKHLLRSSFLYLPPNSLSNPLFLPLSLCLTISLSLRSLLKCEMDLSRSLSTWFPREPRESFESDLQRRWCWLLYSTGGTNITAECHMGNVPWEVHEINSGLRKQDSLKYDTRDQRHLKRKQASAVQRHRTLDTRYVAPL